MDYYNYSAPNNAFPTYGAYQQPQNLPQQFQMQNNCQCDNRFVWSPSKDFARSYPMLPDKTTLFINEDESYAYLRKTDREGKTCLFKTYRLEEEPDEPVVVQEKISQNYISREEFDSFSNNIQESMALLLKKMDEMTPKTEVKYNKPYNNNKRQVRDDG